MSADVTSALDIKLNINFFVRVSGAGIPLTCELMADYEAWIYKMSVGVLQF